MNVDSKSSFAISIGKANPDDVFECRSDALDREGGKKKADELALQFRKGGPTKAEPLTLGKLFDIYEREVTPTKAPGSGQHDKRRVEMFSSFFGASRKPETLSIRDWQRFITERKAGRVSFKRRVVLADRLGEIVRRDLAFLSAVLNFGAIAGDGKGRTLIERNALRELTYPKNDSPKRAVLTSDQYLAVLSAARELGPLVELFVILARNRTPGRGDQKSPLVRC